MVPLVKAAQGERMSSRSTIIVGLLVAVFVLAMGTWAYSHRNPSIVTSDAVRGMIQLELPVGAPPSAIEAFFKRHHIDYAWDKYSGKYVAIIRNVERFHSITINVTVSGGRRFARAEVRDSYTML